MANPTLSHAVAMPYIGDSNDDPNIFTLAEIQAAVAVDSLSVSTVTSQVVSTAASQALDSVPVSTADSKAVSAASRASVADSKAVSGSVNTSVADSKALSVSLNTSVADSKAVSVAQFAPISAAITLSANTSIADSKAVSVATYAAVPTGGRTVTALSTFLDNNACFNPRDFGALGDGASDDRAAWALCDGQAGTAGMGFVPSGTYLINSALTLDGVYQFAKGAKLKPANGITITFRGNIIAGLYQIFDCSAGGTIEVANKVDGDDPYNDIEMNPIWFGADPGGFASDGTTAFQKCFASKATRFFIPYGQYDISGTITIVAGSRVHVRGAGLESAIYFNPSANDTPLFQGTSGDNWTFDHFYVKNNNSGSRTGITAFDLANANISRLLFHRVAIDNFNSYGIKLTGAQHLRVTSCRFGQNRAAIGQPIATAIGSTSFIHAGAIRDSQFFENDRCIKIVGGSAFGINDNSFEDDGRTSFIADADRESIIDIEWDASNPLPAFSFTHNYVESPKHGTGATHAFLKLTNVAGGRITNNSFVGQIGGADYTRKFIRVAGTSGRGVMVGPSNRFDTVDTAGGAGSYGFVETADCVVRCHSNSYYQRGTGELITHNTVMGFMIHNSLVEFDNLTQSVGWDPASLVDGAGESKGTFAVTGAALGDVVDASFDADLQGMLLQGWVASPGNVNVRVQNESGGTIDLASGTLRVRVRKMDA